MTRLTHDRLYVLHGRTVRIARPVTNSEVDGRVKRDPAQMPWAVGDTFTVDVDEYTIPAVFDGEKPRVVRMVSLRAMRLAEGPVFGYVTRRHPDWGKLLSALELLPETFEDWCRSRNLGSQTLMRVLTGLVNDGIVTRAQVMQRVRKMRKEKS